ncbi:MAG TPA: DUF6159 family protein [Balneolales bacterium]|nr:DUF6159 family protein [Balneolales bacterium]
MGKFSRTYSLLKASWNILRADEEILIFPLLSLVVTILFYLLAYLFLFPSFSSLTNLRQLEISNHLEYYAILFVIYFCNYVIVVFFNSAVVACAYVRMNGKNPTVSFGFRAAWSRIHLIIAWSLFAATVGLLLAMVEERLGKIGRLITGIFEVGWALGSFLVIPIFVVEKKGPWEAFSESTKLLKKTWGENLISGVSFGLISIILVIPAIIIMLIITSMAGPGFGLPVIITVIFYFIMVSMLVSVLKTIFQVALYQYARTNRVPSGFDETDLPGAVGSKWS